MFQVGIVGAQEVSRHFIISIAAVRTTMTNALDKYGDELVASVKAHASGLPGPRVITGHYRDSIRGEKQISGDRGQAAAYTNEEYGHRLEYGGTSRTQNKDLVTRPYPHFRPALLEVAPEFVKFLESSIKRL